MLACGMSDGGVVMLSVRQALNSEAFQHTQSSPGAKVMLTVDIDAEKLTATNGRSITGMRWADVVGRTVSVIPHFPGDSDDKLYAVI